MNKSILLKLSNIINFLIKALPYAFLISILLSIGPLVQDITISLLLSEQNNFYDTLNDGKIVHLDAGYFEWLWAYYFPWFIFPSFILVLLINQNTYKNNFIKTSIGIFIVLMASDFIYPILLNKDINMLDNIVPNIIGSPLISIFFILSIDAGNAINNYFEIKDYKLQTFVRSITIIFCSIIITFILYILFKTIYTVTASNINLIAKIPTNGEYNIEKNGKNNFNAFNELDISSESLNFIGFSKNFEFKWNKTEDNKKKNLYNIEVRIINDYTPGNRDIIKNTLSFSPTFNFKDISSFKFNIDNKKFMTMYIFNDKNNILSIKNNERVLFGIYKKNNKTYNISRILLDSDEIKHVYSSNSVSYAFILPTTDTDNLKQKILKSNIVISTEKSTLKINLIPNKFIPKNFNSFVFRKLKDENYNLTGILGGIIITIKKVGISNLLIDSFNSSNEVTIKGLEGWFNIERVNSLKLSNFKNEGEIKFINFNTAIEELYIDEKKYNNILSMNHISIEGKLYGEVLNDKLIISGSSKVIYINQQRVNLSRWEKIEKEYKLLIFSFISLFIIFLFKRLIVIFLKNDRIRLF